MSMWGRRETEKTKDDSGSERDSVPARGARSQTGGQSGQAVPPAGFGSGPSAKPISVSRIGKSVTFQGEIQAREDVHIDGMVEGKIAIPANQLVIGPNSVVQAEIQARSLVLQGKLRGKVSVTEKAEIKKQGHLEGDLVTNRLVIEDGAVFRGNSEMRPAEAEKPVKAKVSQPAVPKVVAKTPPAEEDRSESASAPVSVPARQARPEKAKR